MALIKVSIVVIAVLTFIIDASSFVHSNDGLYLDAESGGNNSEKVITEEKNVTHDPDPEGKEIVMLYVYNTIKDYVLDKVHIKDLTPNGSSVIPSIVEGGAEQTFVNIKFVSPDGSAIDFKVVLVSKLVEKPAGLYNYN